MNLFGNVVANIEIKVFLHMDEANEVSVVLNFYSIGNPFMALVLESHKARQGVLHIKREEIIERHIFHDIVYVFRVSIET